VAGKCIPSGEPLKRIVNRALRAGQHTQTRVKGLSPFRVKPRPLGLRPGLSYDNIGELLEQIEGRFHR
jgi:hypothetical protein